MLSFETKLLKITCCYYCRYCCSYGCYSNCCRCCPTSCRRHFYRVPPIKVNPPNGVIGALPNTTLLSAPISSLLCCPPPPFCLQTNVTAKNHAICDASKYKSVVRWMKDKFFSSPPPPFPIFFSPCPRQNTNTNYTLSRPALSPRL